MERGYKVRRLWHGVANGATGVGLESEKDWGNELREADRFYPWPAPGSEDTELGVLMEPEVGHGEAEVYAGVQA